MKISFVIPAYNKEPYLAEAMYSALNQSHKDIEVVVVNDCSTDGTDELMQYYIEKYKNKIVYIKHEKNMGVGYSRNAGNFHATGEVICVQDADDLSPLNRAEIVNKYFSNKKNKDVSMIYGICAVVNGLGEHTGNIPAVDFSINKLKNENFIQHPTVAYRKNIPVEYRKVNYIDDWYFYMDCVNAGLKIQPVQEILGIYRPLNDGLTLSNGYSNEAKDKMREELKKEFSAYDDAVSHNMVKKNIQFDRLVSIMENIPNESKVLDVGCNDGTLMEMLEVKCCDCEGIEIAPNLVKICKDKGLNVVERDIKNYKLDKEYDYIVFADILEHFAFDDINKILNNFKFTGKEKFIITVPYKHGIYSKQNIPEHKSDFDADFFKTIFKNVEVKNIMTENYAIPSWLIIIAS